jgi:hypothetical protein
VYLRPQEVEAIMKMRGIPDDEREELFKRILILQDIANEMRRNKPQG